MRTPLRQFDSFRMQGGPLIPLGYEPFADLSSAVTLTVPPGAKSCLIVSVDQAVRWRDDGIAPTAGLGMPLPANVDFWYTGDLEAIQFIELSAGASLNVSYYG